MFSALCVVGAELLDEDIHDVTQNDEVELDAGSLETRHDKSEENEDVVHLVREAELKKGRKRKNRV